MPTSDRDGQEGWIYTEPLDAELAALPGPGTSEADTGVRWLPRREWPAEQATQGQLRRDFLPQAPHAHVP
jgi:hypothetical protein